MVETIPNFLHPNHHALLHKISCEGYLPGDPEPLPYCYQPGVSYVGDDFFFFGHVLLNKELNFVSKFYHDIGGPILGRLNYNFIHRMKINLYTNTGRQDKHDFHTDMPIEHKILLYCVNTNNGYTEFEDGSKMPSVANQAYIFNGNLKHRSVSQTNSHIRVNINVVFT